jgi:imidazolonepropionase-like amidohydrolase
MGWEDRVGSLTPGTYADLVITKGNPLDDIKVLENLGGVMKGGEWVIEGADPLQRRPPSSGY